MKSKRSHVQLMAGWGAAAAAAVECTQINRAQAAPFCADAFHLRRHSRARLPPGDKLRIMRMDGCALRSLGCKPSSSSSSVDRNIKMQNRSLELPLDHHHDVAYVEVCVCKPTCILLICRQYNGKQTICLITVERNFGI